MINYIFQWINYLILWSKKTEPIAIIPPNMNKTVGTSPNIKKLSAIPNIGNKEYEGKICPTV